MEIRGRGTKKSDVCLQDDSDSCAENRPHRDKDAAERAIRRLAKKIQAMGNDGSGWRVCGRRENSRKILNVKLIGLLMDWMRISKEETSHE